MQESKKSIKERAIGGLKFTGKLLGAIGSGFVEGIAKYGELQSEASSIGTPKIELPTTVTLGAAELTQLKDMSSWQLESLFKGKRVELVNSPATYAMLKHFNSWQLEAIFGKDEANG